MWTTGQVVERPSSTVTQKFSPSRDVRVMGHHFPDTAFPSYNPCTLSMMWSARTARRAGVTPLLLQSLILTLQGLTQTWQSLTQTGGLSQTRLRPRPTWLGPSRTLPGVLDLVPEIPGTLFNGFEKTKHADIKVVTYRDNRVESFKIDGENYLLGGKNMTNPIKLMALAGWG